MKTLIMRGAAFLLVFVFVSVPVWATCGGGGGGGGGGMSGGGGGNSSIVYHVPWKVRDEKTPAVTEGLILYWFPATTAEIKNSSLRESRDLSLYASQCVSMELADGRLKTAEKLIGESKLPVAVLATPEGAPVGKVENKEGKLKVADVEKMVGAEIKTRKTDVETNLKDAKAKLAAGEKEEAIKALRNVAAQRCMFPDKAKDAAKELKKMGVPEKDEKATIKSASEAMIPEPIFDEAVGAAVMKKMKQGLEAENAGKYAMAERFYAEARRMDPADPTPLRYLAELHRHHTGDWLKAKAEFGKILQMQADPLSRAVALHGMGKITIHDGDFKKGLHLMEDSVATYPTALAYRNLAVYWNSENDIKQATAYTEKALALTPDDAYTQIFAAVFLAQAGKKEEAMAVAMKHIDFAAASYNLAAIFALNGDKKKALELLHRHFYRYERYLNVRKKEMMEARVDAVFASLVNDKDFLALTRFADGKLPMPMWAKPAGAAQQN